MKDQLEQGISRLSQDEILSAIFDYLHQDGVVKNIIEVVRKGTGEDISADWTKYYRMLLATGFVEKGFVIQGGPHAHLYINDEGTQMIMEYGSYLSFLSSKTRSIKSTAKLQELNIMITRLKIISAIIGIVATLITLFLGIQTYKLEKRINTLETILHKNKIEFPK